MNLEINEEGSLLEILQLAIEDKDIITISIVTLANTDGSADDLLKDLKNKVEEVSGQTSNIFDLQKDFEDKEGINIYSHYGVKFPAPNTTAAGHRGRIYDRKTKQLKMITFSRGYVMTYDKTLLGTTEQEIITPCMWATGLWNDIVITEVLENLGTYRITKLKVEHEKV